MKKLRVKFIKGEQVRYLSHLDILRTFNRAIRRSNAPVIFSQGFNPHPSMSFALPLSVGVTSQCELLDVDVDDSISSKEFVETINKGLPEGLKALSAIEVTDKSNIMAIIKGAKYNVKLNINSLEQINKCLEYFLDLDTIVVEKETKSGKKEADIKNNIKKIKAIEFDNEIFLIMDLDAGSVANLKPDTVIDALNKYCDLNIDDYEVERMELIY